MEPAPLGGRPAEAVVSYRLSGPSRYMVRRRDSVVVQMPNGESQTQLGGRTVYLTVLITPVGAESRIEVALDSVRPDDDVQLEPAALDSAVGTQWTGRFLPNGRIPDLSGSRSSRIADETRRALDLLFPVLPEGGARAGAEWSDSSSYGTKANAFDVNERAEVRYRAGADGDPGSLRIEAARSTSFHGNGKQFGQDMSLAGTGTVSLLYRLGSGGHVLEVQGQESTDRTITVMSVGQEVPAHQETTLSIIALP